MQNNFSVKHILYLYTVVLLFPMPTPVHPFITQKSFMFFLVAVSTLYFFFTGRKIYKPLLFSAVLINTSVSLSFLLNIHNNISLYDFISEIIRYSIFFIIFAPIYDIIKKSSKAEIENLIKKITYISIVVQGGVIFLVNTPIYNLLYYWFDLSKTNRSFSLSSNLRFCGIFENPNYFGFFSIMMLSLIYYYKHLFSKIKLIIINFIFLFFVFASGSRTALLVSAFSMFIYYPIQSIIVFLPVSPFVINFLTQSARFKKLLAIATLVTIPSFAARMELNRMVFGYVKQSPIFGWGNTPISMTDNHYTFLLIRYGLFFYFIFFGALIYFLSKHYKTDKIFSLVKNVFMFFIPVAIFSVTGNFLNNFRLFFIFSMIFSLVLMKNKKEV